MAWAKQKASARTAKPALRQPITLVAVGLGLAALVSLLLVFRGSAVRTTPVDTSALEAVHVLGPADAPVTLVEYGDYECPTCADFHFIVAELIRRMPETIRFEFHHFPLPVGAHSITAALAAEAAARQGRFWGMHDALFQTQQQWSGQPNIRGLFGTLAEQAGLDREQFLRDLDSADAVARVARDRQGGSDLGVRATPTFFVNGERLESLPVSIAHFEDIIRAAAP
jgi:protein-disulfide isomerase